MKPENSIVIAPPDADLVLVISASPWLWSAFFLLLVLLIVAFAPKSKPAEEKK